jgi:thiol-disulfide isomerase/thioredoxin
MIKNIKVNTKEDVDKLNGISKQAKETKGTHTHGLLVKFAADWCGFCKSMQNDWDKLTEELERDYECKNQNCSLTIASIRVQDMGNNDEILSRLQNIPKDINGVPVIMFVAGGSRADEYSGDRNYAGIMEWILKNKHFPVQKKQTVSPRPRSRSSSRKHSSSTTINRIIKNARPQFKEVNRKTLRRLHRELRRKNAISVKNRKKTPYPSPRPNQKIPAYLK